MSRYDVSGAQGRYQPGSNDQVLENKLGITSPADRDEAEMVLLQSLYEEALLKHLPDGVIRVADIKSWHSRWQGNLYEWAGVEQVVNMGKGDFQFAAITEGLDRRYETMSDLVARALSGAQG